MFKRRSAKSGAAKNAALKSDAPNRQSGRAISDNSFSTAHMPPKFSDALRQKMYESLAACCEKGEVWGPSAFIHALGITPPAYRSDQSGAKTDGSPNAEFTKEESLEDNSELDGVLKDGKLLVPGSVISAVLYSDINFTPHGLQLSDAIIYGDVRASARQFPKNLAGGSQRSVARMADMDELLEKPGKDISDEHGVEKFEPLVAEGKPLDDFRLPFPGLYFRRCKFLKGGFLGPNLKVNGNVVFKECVLEYIFLQNAAISGNLTIRDCRLLRYPLVQDIDAFTDKEALSEQKLNQLYEAEAKEGDASIEPRASLQAGGISVEGSVRIVDTLLVSGANLDRAHITGTLWCYGSHFQCYKHSYEIAALSLDVADIRGSVWLSGDRDDGNQTQDFGAQKKAAYKRKVTNCLSSDPTIDADKCDTKDVRDRLFCAVGGVNMRGAKIGGSLYCYGSIFVPYIYLEGDEFLTKRKPDGQNARRAQYDFAGPAQDIDASMRCAGVTIGQDVKLDHNFVGLGILDFSSSRIGRQLNFRVYPWVAQLQLWPSFHLCSAEIPRKRFKKSGRNSAPWEASQDERLDYWTTTIVEKPSARRHPIADSEFKSNTHICTYLDLEDGTIDDTLRIYADKKYFFYKPQDPKNRRSVLSRVFSKMRYGGNEIPPQRRVDVFGRQKEKGYKATDPSKVAPEAATEIDHCVIDLRGVETETYTDDFDASDRVSPWYYSVVGVARNWPDALLLHLEGFHYKRFRVDNNVRGGEDLLSYRSRDNWLRLQYGPGWFMRFIFRCWRWMSGLGLPSRNVLSSDSKKTGGWPFSHFINLIPFGGLLWRLSLLVLSILSFPFKVAFNAVASLGKLRRGYRKDIDVENNKLVEPPKYRSRDYIKIDWQPRKWSEFHPQPWLHCANVLRESGRHSDSRHLVLLRERYGLLDKRTVQLEKAWRHALLALAGHSYRRRRLLGWGVFAWALMFLNYQIAWEAGLVIPADSEVHVSDYHLETHLAPPSLVRPNAAFFAIEKLTPGLNFQLEENWAACTEDQITYASAYAECVNGVVGADPNICEEASTKQKPPLACLPRRSAFPPINPLGWVRGFVRDPDTPVSVSHIQSDCLATYGTEIGGADLEGCYNSDIASLSPTAQFVISVLDRFVLWDSESSESPSLADTSPPSKFITDWFNAYYLGGWTRYVGWCLMLFGWTLVGIGAASLVGILRRED